MESKISFFLKEFIDNILWHKRHEKKGVSIFLKRPFVYVFFFNLFVKLLSICVTLNVYNF